MTLEKQVVSLELAKKLKKLGFKKESYFVWVNIMKEGFTPVYVLEHYNEETSNFKLEDTIPAYTVAELGEIFNNIGEIFNNIGADKFIKAYGEVFDFKGTQMIGLLGVINLMRKPDMSAKMFIYLKENKLIK